MADYYTRLSFEITDLTAGEVQWMQRLLAEDKAERYDSGTGQFTDGLEPLGCQIEVGDDSVWISDYESGEPEHIANLVQEFLRRFRPTETVEFSWADLCSRPIINSFGGGAAIVTATGKHLMHTSRWLAEKMEELSNRTTTECVECGGGGYLVGQGYGYADIPDGWTPVQRCDACSEQVGDDEAADRAAAAHGGVAVAYFLSTEESTDATVDDNGVYPGDYAIQWVDREG
jgi:hypothetical protein